MSKEKKEMLNGGDLFIKSLLAENVRYIFGIPGGQLLSIYDAVYRFGREEGLDSIMFRHEVGAAHASDAWARITGTPGVCFGTVGPGAMNLITGVGTAWSDNIPLVVLVPQVSKPVADKFTLQGGLDQVTMFKPVTKYQKHVDETEDIPDAVRKAFREAVSGRHGPVLLEIPANVLFNKTDRQFPFPAPEEYRFTGRVAGDPNLIEKACELLLNAKKPLMIAGEGVIQSEAWPEFQELSEYLGIAAGATIQAMGAISIKCETGLGASLGVIIQALRDVDVCLALGCKFSFLLAFGAEPLWNKNIKVIHVDIDPGIIGRNRPVEVGIVGDSKLVLQQMLKYVKEKVKKVETVSDWVKSLKTSIASQIKIAVKRASKDKTPMRPMRMVKEVLEFIDEDAIIIIDGGDLAVAAGMFLEAFKPRPPRSTLMAAGMGTLGVTVPYAIGARLALKHLEQPNRQIISISGDGSFMINIQDLETAKRYNLPFVCVIGNNSTWGMIKSGQKLMMRKRFIDVDFGDTNFAEIAKGFGCYGERITDPNEIKPALQRALDSKLPAVLDVIIDFETPEGTLLMASMGVL
jgi:acetolactate synthase-1/2/3 large subunit